MNKTRLLPILLTTLFILQIGSLFGQSANGQAQEAEARTPDVSFEVVDYNVVEYPEFKIKVKNLGEETIYLLDFVSKFHMPEFFDWSIEPKYEFGMMEMAEADVKDKENILEIDPGQAIYVDFAIDQSFYPAEPDQVNEVEVTITYKFDPEELDGNLIWYPVNRWDPEEMTREEARPVLKKLTPLNLRANPVRIKVPKPDK